MSAARCGHCGGQAISYGAHFVNLTPTRLCDTCGRPVRKKGFWTVLVVAAMGGMAIGYYLVVREPSGGESWLVVAAVVAVLLVAADYLAWRWMPWTAEVDEDLGTGDTPESEPAESRRS